MKEFEDINWEFDEEEVENNFGNCISIWKNNIWDTKYVKTNDIYKFVELLDIKGYKKNGGLHTDVDFYFIIWSDMLYATIGIPTFIPKSIELVEYNF